MEMKSTRENLLAFLQAFYAERSTALQWQVFQAAMNSGVESCDALRELFLEAGGHIAPGRRPGVIMWHWGNRGGGSSTEQNAVEPPPDWMEDDPSATIAWMARSRNR